VETRLHLNVQLDDGTPEARFKQVVRG
jgi:hypothetical protein